MKSELELLKEANDILRSVNSIIERKGETTNWDGIAQKVKMALAEQHELLLAKNCYIADVSGLLPKQECEHEYECTLDTDMWSSYTCQKCGDTYIMDFE
jgi:hypothetical protein